MRRRLSLAGLAILGLLVVAVDAGAQDIFVTPIPDAPFSGTVSVERTFIRPNGSTVTLTTKRQIARDSQGRIHNEARTMLPPSSTQTPQIVQIHLYDPATRISTMIDPQQKIFWTRTLNRPPSVEPPTFDDASPTAAYRQQNRYVKREDLGTEEMTGVQVKGVRETQTIPAASSGTGSDVEVSDEYWYSSDLRINMAIKHSDPRKGSETVSVTQLSRTEPDASLFVVPDGYTPPKPRGVPAPAADQH